MANISPEVVLGMLFFTLSSANIDFLGRELWWRTYSIKEVLPTTRHIELVGKKKFTATTLNLENEIFIVHVTSVGSDMSPNSPPLELNVHPFCRPQVSGVIAEEANTKVPAEYLDFTDVFSSDLVSEPPKHTRIDDHVIELVNG